MTATLIAGLLLASMSSAVASQSLTTGAITGTVIDSSKTAMPAVVVSARNIDKVILVPDGTYRVIGTVTNIVAPAGPVTPAEVVVSARTGQGLRAFSGEQGNYRLYGLAGDIELRVTKTGYQPRTERLIWSDRLSGVVIAQQ